MEEWLPIQDFPGYLVSNEGRVFSQERHRPLAHLRNQKGYVNVGLTRNNIQYKRSLATLVAQAFVERLPRHNPEFFNTPVHLDGNKENNFAENLVWRPRWFAIKYSKQFELDTESLTGPIVDINTGINFPNSWEASKYFGLLESDIAQAIENRTYVWPLYKVFHLLPADIF